MKPFHSLRLFLNPPLTKEEMGKFEKTRKYEDDENGLD
jgi:hypothetical protein